MTDQCKECCETGHSDECGMPTFEKLQELLKELEQKLEAASQTRATVEQQDEIYRKLDEIGFNVDRLVLME